jgi:hypothetical protein
MSMKTPRCSRDRKSPEANLLIITLEHSDPILMPHGIKTKIKKIRIDCIDMYAAEVIIGWLKCIESTNYRM